MALPRASGSGDARAYPRAYQWRGQVRGASACGAGRARTRLQGALRRGPCAMIDVLRAYRRSAMLLLHVGLATLGYPLAFLLRFEFAPSATEWQWLAGTLPLLVAVKALA